MVARKPGKAVVSKVPSLDLSRWDIEADEFPCPGLFEAEAAYFSTAVHEAGHAVAWYGFGASIREIGIAEECEAERLGYVSHSDSVVSSFPGSPWVAQIIALMAGGAAARKVPRDTINGDGDDRDFEYALAYAGKFLEFDRGLRVRLAEQAGMTWEEAFGPTKITRETVDGYVEKLERVASRMFDRKKLAWRAVKAVAKALLKKPVIKGNDSFEKVIASTGFKRGALMRVLDTKAALPDIPDPHGLLAKYKADQKAQWKAMIDEARRDPETRRR